MRLRQGIWRLASVVLSLLAALEVALSYVLPQGPATSARIIAWTSSNALWTKLLLPTGMNSVRNSAMFYATFSLLLAILLARSIRATRTALQAKATQRGLADSDIQRLQSRPDATIVDCDIPNACRALKSMGFSVRSGPLVCEARTGSWADWATISAWWLLALSVAVMLAGSATRFMGEVALPYGTRVTDSQVNYLWTDPGPLARGRNTRTSLMVREIVHPVPGALGTDGDVRLVVTAPDGQSKPLWLEESWPIGIDRPVMREVGIGRLAVVSLESTAGAQLSYSPVIVEKDPDKDNLYGPGVLALSDESGRLALNVRIRMRVPESASPTATPDTAGLRAIIETAAPQSAEYGPPSEVALGYTVSLSGGQRLRFISDDEWVRVLVIDEWTPLPLAGSLLIAAAAAVLGRWFPRRTVKVLEVGLEGPPAVSVIVDGSPVGDRFRSRLLRQLEAKCRGESGDAEDDPLGAGDDA